MIYKPGDIITFQAEFTKTTAGQALKVTGLTVTVGWVSGTGSLSAVSEPNSEGVYECTLANAPAGLYTVMFTDTGTGTSDVKEIASSVYVADWGGTIGDIFDIVTNLNNGMVGPGADQVWIQVKSGSDPLPHAKVWVCDDPVSSAGSTIGGWWTTDDNGLVNGPDGVYFDIGDTLYIFANSPAANFDNPTTWVVAANTVDTPFVVTGTAVVAGSSETLLTALTELRRRLNDQQDGNYTTVEKTLWINKAKRDVESISKCNRVKTSFNVTAGASDYDLTPIFECKSIRIVGDPKVMASAGMISDSETQAKPDKWAKVVGGIVRVGPTPDATYACIADGFATSVDLVDDTDAITTIPVGPGFLALMNRAESYCLWARPYIQANLAKAKARDAEWAAWCKEVSENLVESK